MITVESSLDDLGSMDEVDSWIRRFLALVAYEAIEVLEATARPGGPLGARGKAWPIKTGRSRFRFDYRREGKGIGIFNRARNRGRDYAYDVELSSKTGYGNPNYNQHAARTVVNDNLTSIVQRAESGLVEEMNDPSFGADVRDI